MKSVHPVDIIKGKTIRYVKVFGNSQGLAVAKNRDAIVEYFVVDTYCMNPDCECNNVYLQFIKNHEQMNAEQADFTITFSLRTKKYTLTDIHGILEKEAAEIVKEEVENSTDIVMLLKQRYLNMKQAGREVLRADKATVEGKVQEKPKRNAPCSCGSGKKYKKCGV
jgi:uncharacterized protein YchJ